MNLTDFSKEELEYTSCYCEENIWKFLKFSLDKNYDLNNFYAVFISNKDRMVPIWYQKSAKNIKDPVIWDYHVICIKRNGLNSLVYDFDTVLNFPENFQTYVKKSFPLLPTMIRKYERLYRVIPAKYYIENFASDRSHMIDARTGEFKADPPKYECIKNNLFTNNIEEFIDMSLGPQQTEFVDKHGTIMRQENLVKYFIE